MYKLFIVVILFVFSGCIFDDTISKQDIDRAVTIANKNKENNNIIISEYGREIDINSGIFFPFVKKDISGDHKFSSVYYKSNNAWIIATKAENLKDVLKLYYIKGVLLKNNDNTVETTNSSCSYSVYVNTKNKTVAINDNYEAAMLDWEWYRNLLLQ